MSTSNPEPMVPRPLHLSADTRGLVCSKCGCRDLRVVYTRARLSYILRLRQCRHCGRRVTTREQAAGV
ncbi:MAG: hypothetical protein IT441_04930 [Phycisphaeraceae bacterium]|nr:hypothetical protein [Phycisphaeraceae bacterium]